MIWLSNFPIHTGKDFSDKMASDFKIPYMRSIGFPDVFNLVNTGVLKEIQFQKLNLKGAVAAKGKTLSTYPSSLGLGTTKTSNV